MMRFKYIFWLISLMFLSSNANSSLLYENTLASDKTAFEVKDETVRERIIIDIKNNEEWEYMIFNMDGSCLRMGILEKGKNRISLKDMCKGEYFVYLSNGSKRYMEKVKK